MLDPGLWILDPGSRILDPGSCILNPGSWIQDPGSRILDSGSWILDPGSWIPDAGSRIQDLESQILDPGSRILNPVSWIQDPGSWILGTLWGTRLRPGTHMHTSGELASVRAEVCEVFIRRQIWAEEGGQEGPLTATNGSLTETKVTKICSHENKPNKTMPGNMPGPCQGP